MVSHQSVNVAIRLIHCIEPQRRTSSRLCALDRRTRQLAIRTGFPQRTRQADPLGHFQGFDFLAKGLSRLENSFNVTSDESGIPQFAMGTAGFPCTMVMGGTEWLTTLPAVTTAPRPMVTLGRRIAPGPMKASCSIFTPCVSRKWAITVTRILSEARSSMVMR